MSTQLISFPPRLGPQGNFVVSDDDSSPYYGEELAVLLLVRPEERELAPEFGMGDPTFDQIDPAELAAKVAAFGPPVNVLEVQTVPLSDNRQDVRILFEPAEVEEADVRVPTTDTEDF
jgi:hypothetical protein